MKIAFVLPVNGIAGGMVVAYRHAHHLAARGHAVDILFSSLSHGLEVRTYPGFALKTRSLAEVVKNGETYDAVIASWWANFYDLFFIRARARVYFCQSDDRKLYAMGSPKRFLAAMTYRYPNSVGRIAMARWIQDWWKSDYALQSEYAPNGIDLRSFNPEVAPIHARGEKLRILIEGPRPVPFKGVDDAFRVASQVAEQNPGTEIWYVSSDGFVAPHWKAGRVFKQVPYTQMPAIYASCDVLLKLSRQESFSLPPLEMLACGGAAVVAQTQGATEYLVDGQNALLVPVGDLEAAARALTRVVQDAPLRARLIRQGLETAKRMSCDTQGALFEEALMREINRVATPEARLHGVPFVYRPLLAVAGLKRLLSGAPRKTVVQNQP